MHDTGVFRYLGGKSKQVCPLPLGWLLLYKFLKEKPENGNQSLLNELPPLYGIGFPTLKPSHLLTRAEVILSHQYLILLAVRPSLFKIEVHLVYYIV